VIALGFGLGEQIPRLLMYPPHFVQYVVADPFFAPLARLHDSLGDVPFGTKKPAGDIGTRFEMFRNGSLETRALSNLLHALENFTALGIEFVSLTEQVDKMVFTVLGAVAELERSLIVERVKAGLRNARAKGKRLGRPRKISTRKLSLPFAARGLAGEPLPSS